MPTTARKSRKTDWYAEVGGIVVLTVAVLGLVALYMSGQGAWQGSGNGPGAVGRVMANAFWMLAGEGRYLLPLGLAWWGWRAVLGRRPAGAPLRGVGAVILMLVILAFLHLPLVGGATFLEVLRQGRIGMGGGMLGGALAAALFTFFGQAGAYVMLTAGALVSVVLITGVPLVELASRLGRAVRAIYLFTRSHLLEFLFTVEDDLEPAPVRRAPEPPVRERREPRPVEEQRETPVRIFPEQPAPPSALEQTSPATTPKRVEPRPKMQDEYQLPPLSLVQRSPRLKNPRLAKDLSENVSLLEETLESFGVKAKVMQVSCGPAITRYELQPAAGVKVSKIVSLADDIALSLAASHVRIEAPIPGKAAVGIEVPNKEVSLVHIREVLETPEFMSADSRLPVALGKDIAGNPVAADLARMPHLLIAGATGSGKSVCMNSLIISLLFRCKPQELKFLMIDPKMVELANYNGVPHLLSPVVTDAKKAAGALRWMVVEMERRYEIFAAAGVRDIERYNAQRSREDPLAPSPALPSVVVLIDELADLMMVAPAEVEDSICRLAQMARAAGIHLVVATQRPSVDVITGTIKANIPSRIAFAVSSQTDSRTILDMGGAEKLLGRGDMLFLPVGAAKPLRVQGVYVSDREVDDVVVFLQEQGQAEFEPGLEQDTLPPSMEREQDDELLPEAVRLFLENGQASISLLQRRLHIGYTRAARLIDLMEGRGFVGGFEGSKPRPLLITWEDYHRLFGS